MANKRITDVDTLSSLNGDESFFVNQNNSIKQINKSSIVFGITNGGTNATTADDARTNLNVYSKSEVDATVSGLSSHIEGLNSRIEDINVDSLNAQKKHLDVTATLSSTGWSDNQQIVSVSGVTIDNTLIVTPSPENFLAWRDAGVYCSAQGNGKLTFKCETTPTNNLTANIVILN